MPKAYQKLGRYLLGAEIASGGMAMVYRAKFVGVAGFEKEFAVKKILPQWSHDAQFARMLIDEAKVLVRLHHPNIVQVFELGLDAGTYFIVMEYVDGWDLRAVLRRLKRSGRELPLPILAHVVKNVCLGLEFAHARHDGNGEPLGIVHRDVSPQNVLLSRDGQVKLTDFGIAKMSGKTTTTRSGVLKGKYAYMSPEQALGREVDQRSDVFSFGALLYEMAVGKKCFEGANDLATLENVKRAQVILPAGLPPVLKRILSRALTADKNGRYRDASEMRRELEVFETGLPERADAEDLKKFLSELGEDEAAMPSMTRVPTDRDGPTRAMPFLDASLTRVPRDSYTVVVGETIIHEATLGDVPGPARSPSPARSPPRRFPAGANTLFFPLGILVIFAFLTASFYLTRPAHRVPGANFAKAIASSIGIAASKPRHEFPSGRKIATAPAAGLASGLAATGRITLSPPAAPDLAPSGSFPAYAPAAETGREIKAEVKPYGTLTVDARPWGMVKIAGMAGRETPARFRLPAGTYALRVSLPPERGDVEGTARIRSGQTVTCRASFAKSKRLTCTP